MRNALVSDFDGTITAVDFFTLIAERYLPADTPDFFQLYREGKMTHVEAMQGYFRYAPTQADALDQMLRDTLPDADLRESVERLRAAGWDLIVVSAGSSWYIDRIFGALGIQATVISNAGQIVEGGGLQIDTSSGVDKPAVVRDALARYGTVAFAGDGPPDVAPALLVNPELRFAKGYLAEELGRRGEVFRPFHRWRDVVEALVAV
ncbi:MAG: HAD-IB family phosphatase [Bryobacteraceae bacterium]|nr:HAD-IB family phosphatase [Bryobacteraceae bacterium]